MVDDRAADDADGDVVGLLEVAQRGRGAEGDRLARAQHKTADAGLTAAQVRRRMEALVVVHQVGIREHTALAVEQADTDDVGREDLAQLVAHEVDHGLQIQLGGQPLLDAVDHRQLGVALLGFLQQPLGLVEQARALQGHAHGRGDRRQQAQLGFAVDVFMSKVSDIDEADNVPARHDRRPHLGHRQVRARHGDRAGHVASIHRIGRTLLEQAQVVRGHRRLVGRDVMQPAVVLVDVGWRDERAGFVEPADEDGIAGEHFAQLVAHQFEDGGQVELGDQPLLDAVDHRQLGIALLGFFQKPLRLVEQPRVLQRHAERGRHRLQQPQLGLAVGALAFVVLRRQQAEHAVAADDGNDDVGQALVGAGPRAHARRDLLRRRAVQLGLTHLDEALGRIRQRQRRQMHPLPMLVGVEQQHAIARHVEPLDADVLDAQHLAQLVAHQIDDGLEVELRRHPLMDAVDQRQLAGALLDLERQPLGEACVDQGRGGLPGQHAQQVALAGGETAVTTFDVGVEEAQPFAARYQRGDNAAALLGRVGTLRAMPQPRLAAAAGFAQPGRDGLQQRGGGLAPWHQAAGQARAFGRIQHQHHTLGTAQTGHVGDQALADRGLALESAHLPLLIDRLPDRPCGPIIRYARRLERVGWRHLGGVSARSRCRPAPAANRRPAARPGRRRRRTARR